MRDSRAGAPAGRRTPVTVLHVSPKDGGGVYYGVKRGQLWNPNAGLAPEAGTTNGQEFADILYQLTAQLVVAESPAAGADPEAALRLSTAQADNVVGRLRGVGEALRNGLDPTGVAYFGRHLRPAAPPQLTVFHPNDAPPFYWEMLYEPDESRAPEDEWEGFWGFRHPVAHWLTENREGCVEVRESLLSVVCEGLFHSNREVDQLWKWLTDAAAALRHERLADALGGRVVGGPAAAGERLRGHLAGLPTKDDQELWLRREVDRTLRAGARDVIHFACHCASGVGELMSRLHFEVGGCRAELTASDVRRTGRLDRAVDEPGPLVFLNACGTAKQANLNEPPGLPVAWILFHGAQAVVATLCPVPDSFAHAFALRFYKLLFGLDTGTPLPPALALMHARRYFMEKYRNPLGLAYTLYAANEAEVRLADRPPGGTHAPA